MRSVVTTLTRRELDTIKAAAAEAYTFGYPLMLSHLASQMTLREAEFERGIGQSARMLACDVWRDLAVEPIVLSLPSTRRYHTVSLFDAWTHPIRSVGTRMTGPDARRFLIVGPGAEPVAAPTINARIEAPSSIIRISIRVAAYSDSDFAAARDILERCSAIPLGRFMHGERTLDTSSTVPFSQDCIVNAVERMSVESFFLGFSALLAGNPPQSLDSSMRTTLRVLGLEPHAIREEQLPDTERELALEHGMRLAISHIRSYRDDPIRIGNWSVDFASEPPSRDYLRRAALARARLCRDVPQDYMRLCADVDAAGDPLDGRFRYRLNFDCANEPPARGPWFAGTSPLLRTKGAIAQRDERGKIEIRLQRNPPADMDESHWLPTRAGAFSAVLHVFWPGEMLLGGGWIPPPVQIIA